MIYKHTYTTGKKVQNMSSRNWYFYQQISSEP